MDTKEFLVRHAKGDPFTFPLIFKEGDVPEDIAGYTVTCDLKQPQGPFTDSLVFTPDVSTPSQFSLDKADTSGWPISRIQADIKVVDNSTDETVRTDIFIIECYQGITA